MNQAKETGRIIEICKETVDIAPQGLILYSLIKLDIKNPIYLLTVSHTGDEAVIVAGRNESASQNIFNTFVKGKVSPCTANDIFKDIILS